jgi:hypothetical protein
VCSRLADPLLVFADCGVAIRETYNTLDSFSVYTGTVPRTDPHGSTQKIEQILTCTWIGGISEKDITYCKVLFFNDVPTIYTGRR